MKQIKLLIVVMLCCMALTGCNAQREKEISDEIAALLNGEVALAEKNASEEELPTNEVPEEEQSDDSSQPDEPENQPESVPPIEPEDLIESMPQIEPEDATQPPDSEDEQINQTDDDTNHRSDDSANSDNQPDPDGTMPTSNHEVSNEDTTPGETTAPTETIAPSSESMPLPNVSASENGPILTTASTPPPTPPIALEDGEKNPIKKPDRQSEDHDEISTSSD